MVMAVIRSTERRHRTRGPSAAASSGTSLWRWGTIRSSAQRNAAPSHNPNTVGPTPPISSAGTRRDQHAAATMMPAAAPIIPSMTTRRTRTMNSTGMVPTMVSNQVVSPPANACRGGDADSSGSIESISTRLKSHAGP